MKSPANHLLTPDEKIRALLIAAWKPRLYRYAMEAETAVWVNINGDMYHSLDAAYSEEYNHWLFRTNKI